MATPEKLFQARMDDICIAILQSHAGGGSIAIKVLTQKALPQARSLYSDRIDETAAADLTLRFRRLMKRPMGEAMEVPTIPGLDLRALPWWIASMREKKDFGEEDIGTPWIETLHANTAQLGAAIARRDRQISGITFERDKLNDARMFLEYRKIETLWQLL